MRFAAEDRINVDLEFYVGVEYVERSRAEDNSVLTAIFLEPLLRFVESDSLRAPLWVKELLRYVHLANVHWGTEPCRMRHLRVPSRHRSHWNHPVVELIVEGVLLDL